MAQTISLDELQSNKRTFDAELEGGSIVVTVTYRPYQMTPAREAAIARISDDTEAEFEETGNRAAATEAGLSRLLSQFCTVVERLGIVGPLRNQATGELLIPEGEPVPVEPEYMRHFSSYFLVSILNAIAEDARPKRKRRDS